MSCIGVVLRNLLISVIVYFPFLFVTISLWALATIFAAVIIHIQFNGIDYLAKDIFACLISRDEWINEPYFYINLSIALIILIFFLFDGVLFSWSTFSAHIRDAKEKNRSYKRRYRSQGISGIFLMGFIVFILAASVPIFDELFTDWKTKTIGVGIVGCISGIWAAISKFRKFLGSESIFKKASWIGERLFEIGAFIFLYAMVVISYNLFLKLGMYVTEHISQNGLIILIIALIFLLAFSLCVGFFVDINYASLGRMYRDRLMEAFLPDEKSVENNSWGLSLNADSALLENMCKEKDHAIRKPYHLINTNVILTKSRIEKYRRRGGDSFLLSPLYCGSDATGFINTKYFMKKKNMGGMTLATAMAISGAAMNPRTGVAGKGPTKGALVSILMTIFNLRLGAWISNPNKNGAPYRLMNYLKPGFCSLFSLGYHENNRYLELTDGGHFENLGLYELVRRRVGTIFVSDAGVDNDFKFGDLANAIEKVRTDFGVSIRFSPEDSVLNCLLPGSASNGKITGQYELAEKGYIIGRIKYPKLDNSEEFEGTIILIKTTMTKNLPADLYSYKAQNKEFPDQPTSDQFFDEKQMEAYRELGYRAADSMCQEYEWFKRKPPMYVLE